MFFSRFKLIAVTIVLAIGGLFFTTAAAGATETKPVQGLFSNQVYVSVTNKTGKPLHVKLVSPHCGRVVETTLGTKGSEIQTIGIVGSTFSGNDVEGTITYPDNSTVDLWAYNPSVGQPSLGFGTGDNWDHYAERETNEKTENGHSFHVLRAWGGFPDDNIKTFYVDAK